MDNKVGQISLGTGITAENFCIPVSDGLPFGTISYGVQFVC
jgi:hypothetical protein